MPLSVAVSALSPEDKRREGERRGRVSDSSLLLIPPRRLSVPVVVGEEQRRKRRRRLFEFAFAVLILGGKRAQTANRFRANVGAELLNIIKCNASKFNLHVMSRKVC